MVTPISYKPPAAPNGEAAASRGQNKPMPTVTAISAAASTSKAGDNAEVEAAVIDPDALENAVQRIEKSAQNLQRSLQFSIDERSGRTVITVLDKASGDVIRQIPEEEVLRLADHFDEFGMGHGGLVKAEA